MKFHFVIEIEDRTVGGGLVVYIDKTIICQRSILIQQTVAYTFRNTETLIISNFARFLEGICGGRTRESACERRSLSTGLHLIYNVFITIVKGGVI